MNALPAARAGPDFQSGIIAGKLNGVMPATTPRGWRSEWTSMPDPASSENSPLSRCGAPAENSTTSMPRWMSPLASGEGLAVLGGQQGGEFVQVLVDQVHELEQDPAAALGVHGAPRQLGLLGAGDDVADLVGAGQRQPGLDLARARIVDVAEAPGGAFYPLSVYIMGKLANHGGMLLCM